MSVNIVDKNTGNITKVAGNPIEQASGISYDHTSSGMQANNVQAAVDELKSGFTNLDNEVNGDATTYPYADVITIEDAVPANVADCSVKIEPVQSGSGDPSPTNIRPITGHTEASVQVADDAENPTVTKTYTIALGDTIYGGTVDFDTGIMTVDRAVVDMGDLVWQITDNVLHVSNSALDNFKVPGNNVPFTGLCEVAKSISANDRSTENACCIYSYIGYVYVRNTGYDNASEFKSDMAGKTICYELATPTTIQLTPQQIQLLKGQNTLTASTGDISVTVNGVSGSIGAVQEQVNELAEDVALKQNATDNNLQTTDKTVVGAVNELKSGLTNLTTVNTLASADYIDVYQIGNVVHVYIRSVDTHTPNDTNVLASGMPQPKGLKTITVPMTYYDGIDTKFGKLLIDPTGKVMIFTFDGNGVYNANWMTGELIYLVN